MTNEESQTSSGLLEALQPLFWSFGTSSAINKTKSRSAIKSPTFTPTGNFHWVHIYNPNQSNKSCSGSTSADRRLSTGSGSPSNFQLCSPSYPLQPTCILTHPHRPFSAFPAQRNTTAFHRQTSKLISSTCPLFSQPLGSLPLQLLMTVLSAL